MNNANTNNIKNPTGIVISVIIPTKNNCWSLERTLISLLQQKNVNGLQYEIIVVDNNSRDDTQGTVFKFMTRFNDRLKYAHTDMPGAANARNKGITQARGDIIAFTDDDCVADPNWLAEIHKAYHQYHPNAIQGRVFLATPLPRGIRFPKWFIEQRLAHVDHGEQIREIKGLDLVGANMVIPKKVFEQYGHLDPSPAFLMNDDTEFSRRISKHNVKIIYNPNIKIYHHFFVERINERKFLKQTFDWGRSNIVLEPTNLPPYRHFLYCLKLILLNICTLLLAYVKGDHLKIFLTKCAIYGCWGRCYQLIDNAVKKSNA